MLGPAHFMQEEYRMDERGSIGNLMVPSRLRALFSSEMTVKLRNVLDLEPGITLGSLPGPSQLSLFELSLAVPFHMS